MPTDKSPTTALKPLNEASHYGAESLAIAEVLHRYFEGLYHSDTALLRRVFHPPALYVTASGGELLHLEPEDYLPIVAARTAPAQTGDPYPYVVESIDFARPETASVRMRSSMLGEHFIDFISLVKVDHE
jgi:hypothetical protein